MEGGVEAEALAKQTYRDDKASRKRNETADFLQWQKDHRRKMLGEEGIADDGTAGNGNYTPYISNMSEAEMAENEATRARGEQETKIWRGKMLYGGVSYAVPPGERLEEHVISPITNMDGSEVGDTGPETDSDQTKHTTTKKSVIATDKSKVEIERERYANSIENIPPAPPTKEELQSVGCYISPPSELTQELSSTQEKTSATTVPAPAHILKTERPTKSRIPDALSAIEKQINDMNLNEECDATVVSKQEESIALEVPKTLYWSEEMDMELASLVHSLRSDFSVIANTLRKKAEDNEYGNSGALSASLITAEECKSRWKALDANQWAELAPDAPSQNVVHKIFINPNILGDKSHGHGAQPSYDQLRTISAGSAPAYLKAPSSLPSTSQQEGEEEDDGEPMKIPSLQEAISKLVSLD